MSTSTSEKHDVGELVEELVGLQGRLRELAGRDLETELVPIWKRPGWTTPAEFFLVSRALRAVSEHLAQVERGLDVVVRGSDLVAPER